MPVELNHTIVWCSDQKTSANFLAAILGRPAPRPFAHFLVVEFDFFDDTTDPIVLQHYAFLVGEDEFDAIFGRIKARGLDYWADPGRTRPGETYRHNGGRGVYFPSPDDHLLEVMTRPYSVEG